MEEENQVFGKNAEAVDSNINLESEDFNFYHQNKEEAKKNIDSSSADLSDFIDSLVQDVPDPSAKEVNSGIEKILERTHPEESKNKASKSSRRKKVTFRVLFIAALLSILSFSCLYVVGNSHNISIENGFVTFTKDTIKIVFFGEEKEEYITIDALLTDLEMHGYDDILFPQEFVNNYDVYKVSVPNYIYSRDVLGEQVLFDVYSDNCSYTFIFDKYDSNKKVGSYLDVSNASTLKIDNIYVYIFEFDNEYSSVEFVSEGYRCSISSNIPYSEMAELAKTLK